MHRPFHSHPLLADRLRSPSPHIEGIYRDTSDKHASSINGLHSLLPDLRATADAIEGIPLNGFKVAGEAYETFPLRGSEDPQTRG